MAQSSRSNAREPRRPGAVPTLVAKIRPNSHACATGGVPPNISTPSCRPSSAASASPQGSASVRRRVRSGVCAALARHCRAICRNTSPTPASSMPRLAQSGDGSHHRALASAHSPNTPATAALCQPAPGRRSGKFVSSPARNSSAPMLAAWLMDMSA